MANDTEPDDTLILPPLSRPLVSWIARHTITHDYHHEQIVRVTLTNGRSATIFVNNGRFDRAYLVDADRRIIGAMTLTQLAERAH